MQELKTPFIIFAVKENSLPDSENRQRHAAYTSAFIAGEVSFKSLLGCYKGDCEESFLVADTPENRSFVLDIARRHNQQSILIVDESRHAELLYLNINTYQPVGKFIEASGTHTLQQDNWIFNPETGVFYTTA